MGPGDMSEPQQQATAAETDQSDQATLTDAPPHPPDPNPEMRDHGQIADMTLPRNWVEGPKRQFAGGIGTRGLREIYPLEAPRVRLCFYYRGLPISKEAGKRFLEILQKPPHVIGQDAWKSLGVVLRDKELSEDFTLFIARTEDWSGRRVMVVEGRYREIQEDNFEIFVDAAGDGRTIQEIFYQAPKDLYIKYLKAAKGSMKSIRWTQK